MQAGPWATYSSYLAAAPSDSALVTCRAIYVGGTGNVTVKPSPGATAVTFSAVPVGTILPIELNEGLLMATGTTATLMTLLQ